MSLNCSSGNFSSLSLGGYLGYPVSTYDSFYTSNISYPHPSTFQLGSSLHGGCQETFFKPPSFQTPWAVTRSYQTSYFHPKNIIFHSPCQTNYTGSLGLGNTGLGSFGYGNTGFQSLGCGSSFCCPTYFSSRNCQSSCYQPAFSSRFFG
ncbi:keratin-associated protein 15-1 [Megaptera novaeangliae]